MTNYEFNDSDLLNNQQSFGGNNRGGFCPDCDNRQENPTCECAKPACECKKPACECAKPACECKKPACECAKPTCECKKPACECAKPACECAKPACECGCQPKQKERKCITQTVCETVKLCNATKIESARVCQRDARVLCLCGEPVVKADYEIELVYCACCGKTRTEKVQGSAIFTCLPCGFDKRCFEIHFSNPPAVSQNDCGGEAKISFEAKLCFDK